MRNDRDLVIEDLTLEVLNREHEVRSYRELLQLALGQLYEAHVEVTRTRAHHHQLLDEYRVLRGQQMAAA